MATPPKRRDIDYRIAVEVMGVPDDPRLHDDAFPYSSDPDDARRVVEEMRERGFVLEEQHLRDPPRYRVTFTDLRDRFGLGEAHSWPEAVCRAALDALGLPAPSA